MKVLTKKIKSAGCKEWLVMVDGRTIATAFTKGDAKFVAKCIRKYRRKS